MKIEIVQKYAPFSCIPGESVLIPGSRCKVKVYPARIEFFGITTLIVDIEVEGPVSNFTIMQDLERRWVRVFGHFLGGFLSYRIFVQAGAIALLVERSPPEGVSFHVEGNKKFLRRKEVLSLPLSSTEIAEMAVEKISLGSHKAQDWQRIHRRLSLEEILPLWFQIGQLYPRERWPEVGVYRLLSKCEGLLLRKEKGKIGDILLHLFQAGFSGLFSPRVHDTQYQAFCRKGEAVSPEISPFMVLRGGADVIRSLFFQRVGESYLILPCLPPKLHAGRMVGIRENKLRLDIEWSKKRIRNMILRPLQDHSCAFTFPSWVKSFRLRRSQRDFGQQMSSHTTLSLQARCIYLLDRFER